MEQALTKGFDEISQDEMLEIDGGSLTACAVIGVLLFTEGVLIGVTWALCD